jgi:lipopolysaccharide biosynthesis glycosyltransferase
MLVVCGADENYALPLAVTLHSMLTNLEADRGVDLYLLDGGIRKRSKRRIERVVDTASAAVDRQWVSVDMDTVLDLPTREWINATTYLRLFIPEILPDRADRALYLDSDLQVEANLGDLWNTDLEGHALGAIRDYGTPYVSSSLGVKNYKELGYSSDTPYFNAGVLLLNLDRWRDDAISEQVTRYLRTYEEDVQMNDQEGLNAVLAEDWKVLDLKWNVMSHLIEFEDWKESPFKERVRSRREELLEDPYVYHFAGGSKPWHIGCDHPAQLEWIEYLWKSGWFTPEERALWFGRWFLRYYWFQIKERLGII